MTQAAVEYLSGVGAIPALLLTSSTSTDDHDRASALGARRCYVKPISMKTYAEIARDIVGQAPPSDRAIHRL